METDTSTVGPRADLLSRLMDFALLAEGLARRFKGAVRLLALTGFAAAVWLAYVAAHAFGLPAGAAVLAGGVLALPPLVLGGAWWVLNEASALPRRLAEWIGRAHRYAGETWQGFQGEPETGQGRLGDLRPLAGLVYELRAMGADARGLLALLGGAKFLASPPFLLVMGGSVLATALLDVAAVAAALLYLVR